MISVTVTAVPSEDVHLPFKVCPAVVVKVPSAFLSNVIVTDIPSADVELVDATEVFGRSGVSIAVTFPLASVVRVYS